MARPKKRNADYFSHDSGMRNHRKIKALRNKFGINGYALFCMLLECLTDADNLEIEYSEIEIEFLAGDLDVKTSLLSQFIEYCLGIKLFLQRDGKIYSPGLKERLADVFEKRERERKRREKYNAAKYGKKKHHVTKSDRVKHDVANCDRNYKNAPENSSSGVVCINDLVSVAETPQSKRKEIKRKENKVNKISSHIDGDAKFLFDSISKIFCIQNQDRLLEIRKSCKVFAKNKDRYNPEIVQTVLDKCKTASLMTSVKDPWAYFSKVYTEDLSKFKRYNKKKTEEKIENSEAEIQFNLVSDPNTREQANDCAIDIFKEYSQHFRRMNKNFIAKYTDGDIYVKSDFIKKYKEEKDGIKQA